MMGWWGNKAYARNGITRLGNNLVHLETRQLSAFTRLCTLCHLNLYLFGIYQVFGRNSKASRCYLLGLAGKTNSVHLRVIAGVVLATLTSVASCAKFVHSQS